MGLWFYFGNNAHFVLRLYEFDLSSLIVSTEESVEFFDDVGQSSGCHSVGQIKLKYPLFDRLCFLGVKERGDFGI